MSSQGIQRFTGRVRLFLVGIVLVLLVTNLMNQLLVRRSLDELRRQTEAAVRQQALLLQEELGRDQIRAELRRWRRDAGNLPRIRMPDALLRRHGLAGIHLLSPEGVALAGNRVPELREPTQLYELNPAQTEALAWGETAVLWPEGPGRKGERVVAFLPVLEESALLGVLRVVREVPEVRAMISGFRFALWAQLAAVLVLLVLVVAFSRWITRPIRLVERTTAGEETGGESDPTSFLLDTYREMISDLKAKEEELRRLRGEERRRATRFQALNRSIVDSLPTGVVVVGPDGRVRETNAIAREILNGSENPAGKPYQEVLESWDQVRAAVAQCLEEGEQVRRQEVRILRDGATRWLEMGVSRLRGEEEGGALLLLGDLTEIKEMERQMQQREMLADLGELSAGVAHEFRNSLGTILGYARMLLRRGEDDEEARAIEEEVHALEKVVRDFLRFADPTRLDRTLLDLEALLRSVAEDCAREGVEITVEGTLPRIRGDETLLRRTFRNLVRNAVEAMAEQAAAEGRPLDGRVEVRGSVTGEGRAARVRVRVEDTGPGIPEEIRERLFQPFTTTRAKGTGLGLALVRKIVLSHNGDIRHEPSAHGGAAFVVSLPLQEQPVPAS